MDSQCAGERLDRREQPLLEPDNQQPRRSLLGFGFIFKPFFSQLAVLIEER